MATSKKIGPKKMTGTKQKPWVAMYTLAGLIWGGSFLFIEYALTALPPIGVAFWRTFFGALAMLIAFVIFRSKLPSDFDTWRKLAIAGLFMSSVPFVLFAYAQTFVSSALASIINAVTPIATVIVMLIAFRSEKLKPHVVVGLVIGLIGVMVVLGAWQGFGDNEPLAIIALLVAVFCYGIGTPYIRKNIAPLNLPTEISVFGQIGTAALSLLPFYLFSGPLLIATPSVVAIASAIAVGAFGSGVAYLLFYKVLDIVGSAIASSVTYITPIIAVLLGVLLLNEQLHWYEPVGGVIVVLGAAISQGSILALFKGKANA
jgi:drug/metabolite transporter (DMT)-like permease